MTIRALTSNKMKSMRLESLWVFHLSKKRYPGGALSAEFKSGDFGGFFLETCQRFLWIVNHPGEMPLSALPEVFKNLDEEICKEVNVYRGEAAYHYCLRFAAGLESEILGETDVFGQLKEAWSKAFMRSPSALLELSPWMQRVFEDTKDIRASYLERLGGNSYGTLVRKIIKEAGGGSEGPILIVGAGQIAQSVAPLLAADSDLAELWFWNRTSDRLNHLREGLSSQGNPKGKFHKLRFLDPFQEREGWREAAHVVVCIPLDPERDVERIQWFSEGSRQRNGTPSPGHRTVIHLGALENTAGKWKGVPGFYSLSELFALQSALISQRSIQTARAERACEQRAKLRSMGASISIPHGWEDLACFV